MGIFKPKKIEEGFKFDEEQKVNTEKSTFDQEPAPELTFENDELVNELISEFTDIRKEIFDFVNPENLMFTNESADQRGAFVNQAASMIESSEIEKYKHFYTELQKLSRKSSFSTGHDLSTKYNSQILVAAQLVLKYRNKK